MRIRPVVAERKLSRRLFEQLADEIKSGRLAPGARLPTERLTRGASAGPWFAKRSPRCAPKASSSRVRRWRVRLFGPRSARSRIEPERMQSLEISR